jgi:hypothetical protein
VGETSNPCHRRFQTRDQGNGWFALRDFCKSAQRAGYVGGAFFFSAHAATPVA